ncbi:phosphohexomutase domain-containing protein [Desulfopila aestuarii]|uniref:Phosphomannomutase n=1 Tax=Desulfopila aestuarii DSM 18488 TaxID=1121416 RepID=A0A1M7YEE8_9BACT|nr:phosphomannomutase [Desulfopila aestuarii]SHO51015.1 phosphomannomutase [Desulfopila aestuarii DSM 18488]
MSTKQLTCFKAYDIRGRVPDELNDDLAYKIGLACAPALGVSRVAVGHDIRLSSQGLVGALTRGLREGGVDVVLLGLCGTEEIYHAAFSMEKEGLDGGIIVTASHNPADYNGMKFVVKGARPVTGEGGLRQMADMIVQGKLPRPAAKRGVQTDLIDKTAYIDHLLGYVETAQLKPLKLVVNSGNGCAGPIVDLLARHLPFEFIRLNHDADGTFPRGVPNPLLPENREETAAAVKMHGADLGIAWDGDFDRCFFFDERGEFIEGYYLVGLLAEEMLQQEPGGTILYDPRLTWNTEELVIRAGGRPVMTKTGHAFIKERMRLENAIYGGEMSAHHYFRDFGYCDSGMIPWLLICSLLSRGEKMLSQLVAERIERFPVSGEINNTVNDPDAVIQRLETVYAGGEIDYTDGLSMSFPDFRFNIRKSNTEPLLRLNVESRGNCKLLQKKTAELLQIIRS